jgi:hypothetical protein
MRSTSARPGPSVWGLPFWSVILTVNGTATAPRDYTAASNILTFTPGQTSKTVRIAVVGDLTVEGPEQFFVVLSAVTNVVVADGQGLVTIVDND